MDEEAKALRRKRQIEVKQRWDERNPKMRWAISAVNGSKKRARLSNVPHDIDATYIFTITSDLCPVFGTPFIYTGNKVQTPESPSIDQLIPGAGYVRGNVVVISSKANNIKSAYSAADVAKVAHWMKKLGL